RQFTQRQQGVCLEVALQRSLNLLGRQNVAWSQPLADCFWRGVDHLQFVSGVEYPLLKRLSHGRPGDNTNRVPQVGELLNFELPQRAYVCCKQIQQILVPPRVPGASDVRMRQLVDQGKPWATCDDRIDVHLSYRDAPVH